MKLLEFLTKYEFIQCLEEAKRLAEGGGIKVNNVIINDLTFELKSTCMIQIGKKKMVMYGVAKKGDK